MHILLVGPGALGCLLSSLITKGIRATGDKLTILDYNPDRADFLTRQGLIYHIGKQSESVPVTVISNPEQIGHADVVLLCVKSYSVTDCLAFCTPVLSDKTLLIFMQNGISHLESHDQLQKSAPAYGTTTEGATLLETGQVRHAGRGSTHLGFLNHPHNHGKILLQKTAAVLSAGGLEVHHSDNILARLWAKLFINIGINALTATLACKNGELLSRPGVTDRMQAAIQEAVLIAQKKTISINDDPYQTTRLVCSKTSHNLSSMLQDIKQRRRTEINAINGAIVKLGTQLGIDTPENSLLCQQIRKIEDEYNP